MAKALTLRKISRPGRPPTVRKLGLVDRLQDIELGPAMMALTSRQQRFVVAYWETNNATEATRLAGYSDTNDSAKAQAWRLAQNPRIKAALIEFTRNVLTMSGVKTAVQALLEIAGDAEHKDRIHAAKTILDRVGIHAATEHKVDVNITLTREEKVSKLKEFAQMAGIEPGKVLGSIVDLEPDEFEPVDNAP